MRLLALVCALVIGSVAMCAPPDVRADTLYDIRMCESRGDYAINTGNGYYGAYQFALATWQGVGGTGLPSDASPAEQDYRAWLLLTRYGRHHWPNC